MLLCFVTVMAVSRYLMGGFEFAREPFVFLFMGEMGLVLFFIPLLAIGRGNTWRPKAELTRLMPTGALSRSVAQKILSPLRLTLLLCAGPCVGALAGRLLFGGIPAGDIARASLVILAIGVCALALGWYCSILCYDIFSAAGLTLLVILLVCTEPLWIGPVIESTSNVSLLIQSSLLINPIVGMASSLDFDIFRAEPFYQICPIGQRRFTYPPWYASASFYGLVSILLLWRSAAGIRKLTVPST
jgi:hypothetical protein